MKKKEAMMGEDHSPLILAYATYVRDGMPLPGAPPANEVKDDEVADFFEVYYDRKSAHDRYDSLIKHVKNLHSASICAVIKSTDYDTHPALAASKNKLQAGLRRLKSVDSGQVLLEVLECVCGSHFGLDATYMDQVRDFKIPCPSCGYHINTKEMFPE